MLSNIPDFSLESRYSVPVAGVDEAGRGPLAGPVVAAAVILNPRAIPKGIHDSKKLSAAQRDQLFTEITASAVSYAIGIASVEEIDRLNILHASMLAMERALCTLSTAAGFALIDGNRLPSNMPCPGEAIIRGDAKSLSIAAASILAKVTRDRIMRTLAEEFPHYGWHRNAGYPVKAHLEGLQQHGITPHHRRSFAPVRRFCDHSEVYHATG